MENNSFFFSERLTTFAPTVVLSLEIHTTITVVTIGFFLEHSAYLMLIYSFFSPLAHSASLSYLLRLNRYVRYGTGKAQHTISHGHGSVMRVRSHNQPAGLCMPVLWLSISRGQLECGSKWGSATTSTCGGHLCVCGGGLCWWNHIYKKLNFMKQANNNGRKNSTPGNNTWESTWV